MQTGGLRNDLRYDQRFQESSALCWTYFIISGVFVDPPPLPPPERPRFPTRFAMFLGSSTPSAGEGEQHLKRACATPRIGS